MRKNVKVTATSVSTIGPETVTARFENVKTRSKEDIVYTELGTYEGIKTTNYKTDGNIKLSEFRENLISLRTKLKMYELGEEQEGDEIGFSIYLKIDKEDKPDESYYIQIIIYRKVVINGNSKTIGEDEYAKILVLTSLEEQIENEDDTDNETESNYYYGIKDLVVDSDIDDRIWRFVGENEWRSTTYLLLDLNKNLAINKSAYLTLNLPFNNNIGWYEPVRKTVNAWYSNKEIQKIE